MSFTAAFAQVFRTITSNFALASIIVLAVILYGSTTPPPMRIRPRGNCRWWWWTRSGRRSPAS